MASLWATPGASSSSSSSATATVAGATEAASVDAASTADAVTGGEDPVRGGDRENVARASAARALAVATTPDGADMMSTALILEFIASCVDTGVEAAAFDSYRSFVEAVDTDADGNVSRSELYDWLVQNRDTFSTAQLRMMRDVMTEPRYVETKYGMEMALEEDASAVQRSDAAADVADTALESGLAMSTREIFDFIDAAVEAGVDSAAFDTQRAFLSAADSDGNGTVDRGELKLWIDKSKNQFTKEQIELILEVLKRNKRRDTGRPYSESKFGMYM